MQVKIFLTNVGLVKEPQAGWQTDQQLLTMEFLRIMEDL